MNVALFVFGIIIFVLFMLNIISDSKDLDARVGLLAIIAFLGFVTGILCIVNFFINL